MTQPFPIDADEFDLHEAENDPNALAIHLNPEIEQFLATEGSQAKRVLVGGKGYGKTLLLKKKALQYRSLDGEYLCVPSDRLCEKISSFLLDLDPAWFEELAKIETWTAVWEVTIATSTCRTAHVHMDQKIERVVPVSVTSISDVLSHLARGMKSLNACKGLVVFARAAFRAIDRRVACFIDNVDEGLKHLLGRDEYKGGLLAVESNSPRERIWISAQLGLLEAIRELRHINRKVRLFATIRQEAFDRYDFQTRAQVKENCAFLSYSNQELLEIFKSRCLLVPASSCAKPKDSDPLARFLGFRRARARPDDALEEVGHLILRHTLGRPRDLMRVGSALLRAKPSEAFDEARFVREVLCVSEEIYTDFKVECVPYWCAGYEKVFALAGTMVLTSSEVHRIAREFEEVNPDLPHPFCYYFHHGLLGCIGRDVDGKLIQSYSLAGAYVSSSTSSLAKSHAYFFHPCLSGAIARATLHRAKDESPNLDQLILCGRSLPIPDEFLAKLRLQDSPLLVHIGNGKVVVELDEQPDVRAEWKLQALPAVLIASALVTFHHHRVFRMQFEAIGQTVDELITHGAILPHAMSARMPVGCSSLGEALVLSLKEDKCRSLEEANKRFKALYPGQVFTRDKGSLVLNIIDPKSLQVRIE